MVKSTSDKLARYLASEVESYRDKEDVLSYGIQIILGISFKTISLLLISFLLGIHQHLVITLISYITFRCIIGGTHCSTFNSCYITTLGLFLTVSLFPKHITISLNLATASINAVLILGILTTFLWIPSSNSKRKYCSLRSINILKIKVLFMLALGIIILNYLKYKVSYNYIFSSVLGVLLAFILVTPLGYQMINKLDLFIINLMKGGKANA